MTPFSKITHPNQLPPSEFISHNQPFLVQRNDPSYFSGLLSKEDLFAYFRRNDLSLSNLYVVKNGVYIDKSKYSYGAQASGKGVSVVDTRKVFELFNDGATIFIGGLEYSIESLRVFYQAIMREINCPAGLAGFYTPSNSQGFKPHIDDVDVFVMQLFGSKVWRVYNCPMPYSIVTADCTAFPENLLIEVELKAGDTLYVPRGYIHEAEATKESSFHISLSLSVFNWIDVFKFVCQSAPSLVGFRSPFPMEGLSETDIKEGLSFLFDNLLNQVSSFEIQQHLQNKVDQHLLITNNDYLDSVEI